MMRLLKQFIPVYLFSLHTIAALYPSNLISHDFIQSFIKKKVHSTQSILKSSNRKCLLEQLSLLRLDKLVLSKLILIYADRFSPFFYFPFAFDITSFIYRNRLANT